MLAITPGPKLITPKWHDAPHFWPRIEPWVKEALTHGGVTLYPRDIYEGLTSRQMKLWLASEPERVIACCITRVINYQRMRSLEILVCGGEDMNSWTHFYSEIEKYARTLECDAIEFGGRKGWARVLNDDGFKEVYVVHRKMLTE